MELSKYIAVLCEGACEAAIIDILLDNDALIFQREDMIEESVLRVRKACSFEKRYLRKEYDEKVSIIRILDSRKEKFLMFKEYLNKIDVINIITAPEIEMLVILNENKYKEYKNSKKKPSNFCKENLKMKNVKQYDFIRNYFSDYHTLINAISLYDRISTKNYGDHTLKELLRKDK